jgi:two-component system nitrogen regulation response regulator NtrX
MNARKISVPVIMISGQGTIRTALKATELGVFDFIEKPLDPDRILLMIKNALERRHLERGKASLLQTVKDLYVMIGRSPEMLRIHELILKASKNNSKVLIEGDNGTGKELVARAIHHNSTRRTAPSWPWCAAIPIRLSRASCSATRKGVHRAYADKQEIPERGRQNPVSRQDRRHDSDPGKVLQILRTGRGIVDPQQTPLDVRLVAA